VFGREYLEVLELFPASDFAADLCAGFRDYRVVICASSFRKCLKAAVKVSSAYLKLEKDLG